MCIILNQQGIILNHPTKDGGLQCLSSSGESAEQRKPKCPLLEIQELLPRMDASVLSPLPPARDTEMLCKALSGPRDGINIRSTGDGHG